ncbi:MAG: glycoside hydrolase family 43 protein, partial [Prevotella sp.]|nr:glycoside hydrolase family 43 protein [Prevotella sp.]
MNYKSHIFVCIASCLLAFTASNTVDASNATKNKSVNSSATSAISNVALFDFFSYKGNDDFYNSNPLTDKSSFYNPILPGWFSDPSICTNGEGDYFLVTSTFVYYPGVPIFHSRDLVNWKQIGYVLDRSSQLEKMHGQNVSGGVFAPAISYNPLNKTYYMITTNVGAGNFFVKTKDPFGSWSEPIMLPEIDGIDPSFFFDEDGHAYIVHNADAPDNKPEYDGHRSIRVFEFDVEHDKIIGEEKVLVNKGTHPETNPIWIEGPHMYKINDKYFLMSAEGGTGDRHSEVIFRSDSPWGPFTAWENNPILTQRHLSKHDNAVTCAGHADLVQAQDGNWWAVFLACRPIDNDFENLGRETFMLPVNWSDDGFPYLTQGDELVPLVVKRDGVTRDDNVTFGNFETTDNFDENSLGLEWMTLRGPATDLYSLTERPGWLALRSSDIVSSEMDTPAFVCRRLQHHKFECSTRMVFNPSDENEAAGLLLFKDETHQYFISLNRNEDGNKQISLWRIGDDGKEINADKNLEEDVCDVYFKIT